jgi:hypothetical protein
MGGKKKKGGKKKGGDDEENVRTFVYFDDSMIQFS